MPELVYSDAWTQIICGDTIEVMNDPEWVRPSSIQMVMTSVPYLRQRKYTQDGWGWEESVESWLVHMKQVELAVLKVLKTSGVYWFNAGDKWGGSTAGSDYGDKRVNEAPADYQKVKSTKLKLDNINRKGNLMMLPERAAIQMIDSKNFTLINKVIWQKTTRMVQSYKRKFVDVWEPLYFLAKDEEKYIFNNDDIGVEQRGEMDLMFEKKQEEAVLPPPPFARQMVLSHDMPELWNPIYDADHPPPYGTEEYTYWYNNVRGKQSWHDHKEDDKNGQRFDSKRSKVLKNPRGSNPGDVWPISVNTDSGFFGKAGVPPARYWPSWPEELCKLPIIATSSPGDIVLDPFCGSGTLGVVAKELGRKSIMIDVDIESCRVAAVRMMKAKPPLLGKQESLL